MPPHSSHFQELKIHQQTPQVCPCKTGHSVNIIKFNSILLFTGVQPTEQFGQRQ